MNPSILQIRPKIKAVAALGRCCRLKPDQTRPDQTPDHVCTATLSLAFPALQPLLQGANAHVTRLTNIDAPILEFDFLYSSDLERSSVAPPSVALTDRLLPRPSDPAAPGITLAVDCPAARLTCQVARDVTANFFNAAQRSPRPLKVLKRYPLRFEWSSSSRHHPYASRISPSRLRPNK
ncbi:hypothetical protein CSAL01_08929 [Colletotrichum salicis]|uniref:Uncharacterized protein n=1 Tax=Colletotrichum salicis TaxID=1209931 RepID=A0A135SPG0_9PEZI|nr:hypothetical protein CSAL01_08929 [Colletotrichum salicis]